MTLKRMAGESLEDFKERARRFKRNEARNARRLTKKAAEAASMEVEAPPVTAKALGVNPRSSAGPKNITQAREQLTQAFEDMGGVAALVKWGKLNPTEFFRIWARLIPKDAPAPETALPLETLLAKLAQRADQSIEQAAAEIGQEALDAAEKVVSLEDAVAAYKGVVH